MPAKDSLATNIRNGVRVRKKEKKIKDAATTSSKSLVNDEELTLLLKIIVKKLKTKRKKTKKIQLKNRNGSNYINDDEVKCNECQQLFSKSYFIIHMQSHKALYKCEICDKNFSYLSILNRHKATHKRDIVEYECKLCDKTFRNTSTLSIHNTFHDRENIKCLFCFKTFKQFDDFLNHINMYSFEQPSKSVTDRIKIHSEGNHCSSCCTCKMSFAERDTVIKYII